MGTNVANTVGIHGVAPAAIPAVHGAYAGAGRYVVNSAGTVHVAKREAEATPDAYYNGYGYGGYGLDTESILMDMDIILDTLPLAMVVVLDTDMVMDFTDKQ